MDKKKKVKNLDKTETNDKRRRDDKMTAHEMGTMVDQIKEGVERESFFQNGGATRC